MSIEKILIVDDEVAILHMLKLVLQKEGFSSVDSCTSGEEALTLMETNTYDLIILDIMLPGMSGYQLLPQIRSLSNVPIFFISAKTSDLDKLTGFAHGCDDYITKPFHPKELVARIEVLLRRYDKVDKNVQHIQHLCVNMKEQRIIRTDTEEEVVLSGKQHHLFFFFMRHLNQTLRKEQLFEAIWKLDYIEGDKTLMVHIRYLREKIERNPSEPTIIETIRGIGYRFKS